MYSSLDISIQVKSRQGKWSLSHRPTSLKLMNLNGTLKNTSPISAEIFVEMCSVVSDICAFAQMQITD